LTALVVADGAPEVAGSLSPQHWPLVRNHIREVLHLLAAGTRAQLLEALPDLVPGVVVLAGHQGLVDIAAAIRTVRRWWP
jgi:hypothetical protein